MNQRPWIGLLLLGVGFLIVQAAPAQTGSTPHRFILPPSESPLDEEGLSARVRDFSEQRDIDALVQTLKRHPELLNSTQIDQLRKQAANDPHFKDPKFRDQVKQALAKGQLTDEQKSAIQKAASGSNPPPDTDPRTPDPDKVVRPGKPKRLNPNLREEKPEGKEGARSEDLNWLNRQGARRLNSLVRMLDRNNGRDSDRFRTALTQLINRNMPDRNLGNGRDPTGLGNSLGRLGKYLSGDRAQSGVSDRLNRLPSTPNLGNSSSIGGSWSSPSLGSSSVIGSGGALMWLLIVVLILAVVWQVKTRIDAARGVRSAWQLGPWPVNPHHLASRGDLVKAFEYLACLLLGPQALTANHLDLVERIAANRPAAARQAAGELGHLYEQARYAAPDDPLPDGDLAMARRHLLLLAEGSA
jgi:hypothetical protein